MPSLNETSVALGQSGAAMVSAYRVTFSTSGAQ